MTPIPAEVESLLACLRHVTQTGPHSWKACCPAHADTDPSLAITVAGDKILVFDFGKRCSADAIVAAIGKTMADLFIRSNGAGEGPPTLEMFAAAKGFTVEFLQSYGVTEDAKGLLIPYHRDDGQLAPRARRRTALRAKDGSTWTGRKGDPLIPYGLPYLAQARATGELIVTEGETNQLTAVLRGMPAIGIPGAQLAKVISAGMLTGITRLCITQDPDDGGEAFVQGIAERLGALEWSGEAKVVRMPPGIKDLNDLHRLAGERFAEEWQRCCDQAEMLAIPAPDRRPVIVIGALGLTEMAGEVWDAVEAANHPVPSVFRFGTTLAWITTEDDEDARIEVLGRDHVADRIDRVVKFIEVGMQGPKRVFPPGALARNMLTVRSRNLPRLLRIVRTPVFAADGRLVTAPGYDSASRIYVAPPPDLVIPEIPTAPTSAEVREAVRWLLEELLGDVPFVDAADTAHALALPLTVVLRDLIPGNVPMFAFDKPQPRSGATLTVQLLYIVVDGGDIDAMTATNDKAEMRKRLTAALESAPSVLLLDNVHGRLDSDALASILTTSRWSDRRLGYTEKITIPVRGLIAVTGNNLQLSNELAGRSVLVRIDPRTEKPWERSGFRYPDIKGWARKHRGHLLWAVLTLAQAWIAEDQPRPKVSRAFGGFEGWVDVLGGVLDVAGVPGFLENQGRLFATMDTETATLRAFVGDWWTHHTTRPVATKDLFDLAKHHDGLDIAAGTEQGSRSRLGLLVASLRDRTFTVMHGGASVTVVVRAAPSHANANRWQLERIEGTGGPKGNQTEGEGNRGVTATVTELSTRPAEGNGSQVTDGYPLDPLTRARVGTDGEVPSARRRREPMGGVTNGNRGNQSSPAAPGASKPTRRAYGTPGETTR